MDQISANREKYGENMEEIWRGNVEIWEIWGIFGGDMWKYGKYGNMRECGSMGNMEEI